MQVLNGIGKSLKGIRDWLLAQQVALIAAFSVTIGVANAFGWWKWNDVQTAAVMAAIGAYLALLRGYNGPITPAEFTGRSASLRVEKKTGT